MVTVASAVMIMSNPPSFGMDEESFMPDNESTRANKIINESFTSTTSIMSMVDARNAGGDIFTVNVFLDVLEYEKQLYKLEYTDPDGVKHLYSSLPGFMVMNPVTAVARAIYAGSSLPALPDPKLFPDAYYDALKGVISMVDDATIKAAASAVLDPTTNPMAPMLLQMLAAGNEVIPGAIPGTGTASASGCIVYFMMSDDSLGMIQDGQLGFEHDVLQAARSTEIVHAPGLKIRAVGMETMMQDIGRMAQEDISMLLPIAIVVIVILLLIIYRDVADTLIGLMGLGIAVIWTFGLSALLNIGMSTIAIAVPILILALGIDYGLHLVFRHREERKGGADSKGAISMTMRSVGMALVLATLTTAVAFLSYLTSEMSALANFGVMCAIGIVCAFASMLLLIPAAQAIRDRRAEKKGKDSGDAKRYHRGEAEKEDKLGRISGVGGKMAAKNPWAVLGAVAIIVALCGYSATNLSYDFDMYEFVPSGTEAHEIITYLNENYSTTTSTTSVLIFADPWKIETIMAIEDSLTNMADPHIAGLSYSGVGPPDAEYIGSALLSLKNTLKAAADAAGPFSMENLAYIGYILQYGAVFDINTGMLLQFSKDNPATAQWVLDNLKDYIFNTLEAGALFSSVVGEHNGEPVTRIILKMTTENEGNNDAVLAMRDSIVKACEPLSSVSDPGFIVTGQAIIMAVSLTEMNKSQMTSLMVTIIFVILILTLVMFYTHRSWLLGTMATIPTLVSVVMVWGTMAAIGMPLNVMTLTIASLAVGLGVTYGIHITHRYVTELVNNDLSAKDAIKKTMRETGKGVFAAAITTIAGFGVMGFSKILPMYQFGIITALAITFGYMGSILVLPSMLVIWGERAKKGLVDKHNGVKRERADTSAYKFAIPAAEPGTSDKGFDRYKMERLDQPKSTKPAPKKRAPPRRIVRGMRRF